jgi:hypothetical protein
MMAEGNLSSATISRYLTLEPVSLCLIQHPAERHDHACLDAGVDVHVLSFHGSTHLPAVKLKWIAL